MIGLGVVLLMLVKGACVFAVGRIFRSSRSDAADRAVLMAQGGEFAFVLFAAASANGLIDAAANANLTAVVVLSMVLTPFVVLVRKQFARPAAQSLDGVEVAEGLSGSVLVIGFRPLRAGPVRRCSRATSTSPSRQRHRDDPERREVRLQDLLRRRHAARLLRASGAATARAIAVCVEKREVADKIVELVQAEHKQAKLLVRSYDRAHSLHLVHEGVEFQIRETFESALLFGQASLVAVGVPEEEAATITADVRQRDLARFEMQLAEGIAAGREMMRGNLPKPTPLTPPRRAAQVLGEDGK